MTPAVVAAKAAGIAFRIHEYEHSPGAGSWGEEAADKLGVAPGSIFKTLVVESPDKRLAVAVVPVLASLDLKAAARSLGVKKLQMADKGRVQKTTGYVLGGVSPLGQKQLLPTIIDTTARDYPVIHVSAGRRGLEISMAPDDLGLLCGAGFVDIGR